jgi:hypothetical protein
MGFNSAFKGLNNVGRDSSVGITTDYELGGPGIESRWEREFPHQQTSPRAHPASCTMGTGYFPGVKCGRGVLRTTHPPSSAEVLEEIYNSNPRWGTAGPVMELLYLKIKR